MARIDRQRAREAFAAYVAPYDIKNPRIALKVKHTYRVAAIGERVARAEGLAPEEVDLAWLCCLLHDLGRFEQLRRWDTFKDGRSASHALIGAAVLFGENAGAVPVNGPELAGAAPVSHPTRPNEPGSGRIESFIEDRADDDLIRTAVAVHSNLSVPTGLDARTRFFCDLVRDADKVDIFRASAWDTTPQTVLGVDEDAFLASAISPDAEQAFFEERCLARDESHTPLDNYVGTCALIYELVFPESFRIAHEQGYYYRDLATPYRIDLAERPFALPETRATWARMGEHARSWLSGRLAAADEEPARS